ncbi:PIN domain-containing protein [Halobaculum rarum]|uniref:PIN domain-containing protein n=1 Tax=Halobaculum rarum TaxID=3075122 RepID=UPI0032AFEB53
MNSASNPIQVGVENYEGLLVEKSGIEPQRVQRFIDLLFQYIEVVPGDELYPYIEEADAVIGETDPDDVLYVACALASNADIWSGDSEFDEQVAVETHSTSDVIDSFDTR